MAIQFDDQVVLITGSGGSLGRAYAKAFAARGAKVVINDLGTDMGGSGRSCGPAENLAKEIRNSGGEVLVNTDNIADRKGVERLIQQIMDHYGRIDVLINNAGSIRDKVFKKMDLDDFDAVVQVNLMGSAYVTHAVFPIMVAQNYGRIVMTTSAAGLYGVFGAANYSAAKLGVVGLMNTLKLEGARHNVLVNAIAPIAASRMMEALVTESTFQQMLPEYVSPVVLYLSSDKCVTSGDILEAGVGYCAKVQIIESPGIRFPLDKPLTPEVIEASYDDIADMKGAKAFSDCQSLIEYIVAPLQ